MAIRVFTYSLILITLLLGCEQETDWVFDNTEPHIVVDALITSEYKAQEVYIYESEGGINGENIPINNAEILISDGTQTVYFEASDNNGKYLSEPFATAVDKEYMMVVRINGYADTAYARMQAITPFLNDTIYESDGLYKFIYGGSDLPAMTEVFYDWSHTSNYCEAYGSCFAKSVYYTLNNIDIAEEFGPEKQEIWFPKGTTLVRQKYSLSPEHETFVRSLLIETEWRGGLFDIEQGNVPTNFQYALKGWFGVCMVISDTTQIK